MLPARMRSLRSELTQAAATMSTSSHHHRHDVYAPPHGYPHPPAGRTPQQHPQFSARQTVVAPERITAAAQGVQELDQAYRRFRTLEHEIMGHAALGTGSQTPEQVLDEVRKQVAAAVSAAGDAEKKASAHLDRYYQWTYAQRSHILAYWADADVKRREAAALKISKEKEIKAKSGKEAADKAAVEATAAMKAMELEMKKNVVTYQAAVKKDMGLLEAEIKKIVAFNKDVLVMPPKVASDPEKKETVGKSLDVALADASQRAAHARSAAAALAPYTPVPSTLALGPLVVGGGVTSGGGRVVNSSAVPLTAAATGTSFDTSVQHGYMGWPGAMGGYGGFGSVAATFGLK